MVERNINEKEISKMLVELFEPRDKAGTVRVTYNDVELVSYAFLAGSPPRFSFGTPNKTGVAKVFLIVDGVETLVGEGHYTWEDGVLVQSKEQLYPKQQIISAKKRIKQLHAEQRAAMRIVKLLAQTLSKQLSKAIHPVISQGAVSEILDAVQTSASVVTTMCNRVGNDPDKVADETLIGFLKSDEGKQLAFTRDSMRRKLRRAIESWDDGLALARGQIESYEPTALTVRDRALCFEFTALLRQAEALDNTIEGLLYSNQIQVWFDKDGNYHFTGQVEE
jgi:hypothetical protein